MYVNLPCHLVFQMIFETLDNLKAFSACEFGQLFCIHYILVTCRFMETKDTRFQNKQEQI